MTFEQIADFSRKIRKDDDNIDIDDDDVNIDAGAAGSSSTLTASERRLKKLFYDSDGVETKISRKLCQILLLLLELQ